MANGKTLRDLKRGDKVYLSSGVVLTVTRANSKSVSTSDGSRWDLSTARRPGDPGIGRCVHAEPYDADRHPYVRAAGEAKRVARDIVGARAGEKAWASVRSDLERVLEVLNGKR